MSSCVEPFGTNCGVIDRWQIAANKQPVSVKPGSAPRNQYLWQHGPTTAEHPKKMNLKNIKPTESAKDQYS